MKHEQYRIAGFFNEKEKSLNQVTLSLDCGKSLAKRLSQQIWEMQKNCGVFWKPRKKGPRTWWGWDILSRVF